MQIHWNRFFLKKCKKFLSPDENEQQCLWTHIYAGVRRARKVLTSYTEFLTGGEKSEKHSEDSAHVKRRGSSSFPHNHPSSSGSRFAPLPGHMGLNRGEKLAAALQRSHWEDSPQNRSEAGRSPSLITAKLAEAAFFLCPS